MEDQERASRGIKEGEFKNVHEVNLSRHITTTAESSSVKRSEEEVWSQRWHEEKMDDRRAGGAKKERCSIVDSATAVQALEQDAASLLAS